MTINDLIADHRGKLGIRRIWASGTGVLKKLADVKVQICTNPSELLNHLVYQTPLIINRTCMVQLKSSSPLIRRRVLQNIKYWGIPWLALSDSLEIPDDFKRFSEIHHVPIVSSLYDEHLLESRILGLLREKIEQVVTIYGVLVDYKGAGLLIRGESDVGKTRLAVCLIGRGYRWVADDVVEIEKRAENVLCGRPHRRVANLLEWKPFGIVNVVDLFGTESVCRETLMTMILDLAKTPFKEDATVKAKNTYSIMGVELPVVKVAVSDDISAIADHIQSCRSAA
ncbi:MAG: hypothetical protein JXA41_14595 [Deltaproteobacteria bacterium]|nr:hypothetical protein [Deltaproteobacteria bacterium]